MLSFFKSFIKEYFRKQKRGNRRKWTKKLFSNKTCDQTSKFNTETSKKLLIESSIIPCENTSLQVYRVGKITSSQIGIRGFKKFEERELCPMFYFHEDDVTSVELSLCQRIGDAHALLITLRESSSEVISMKLEHFRPSC